MTDEIVEINKDTDVSLLTTIGVNAEAKASRVPMVARVDIASRLQRGERASIAVKTESLHFFDLASGDAIVD